MSTAGGAKYADTDTCTVDQFASEFVSTNLWLVISLVGALSPVNHHKGLHQG